MLRHILLGSIALAGIAFVMPANGYAQDTQQTDQQEEDWRNSQRKSRTNDDFDPIINPQGLGSGGILPPLEPIETLPEESRRHLKRQRAKVIGEVEFGEDPGDVPYEPSEAAKQDPNLAAEEEAVWETILTDLNGGGGSQDGQQGQGGPNNVAIAGQGGGNPGSVTRGGSAQSASDILRQLKGLQQSGNRPSSQTSGGGSQQGTDSTGGNAQTGTQSGQGSQAGQPNGGAQGQAPQGTGTQQQGQQTQGGQQQGSSQQQGQQPQGGQQQGSGQQQGQQPQGDQQQGSSQQQGQQTQGDQQGQQSGQAGTQSQSGNSETPQSVTRGGSADSASDILRSIRGGQTDGGGQQQGSSQQQGSTQGSSSQTGQNSAQDQSQSAGQSSNGSDAGESSASGDAGDGGADGNEGANGSQSASSPRPTVGPLTIPRGSDTEGNGGGSRTSASDFLKGSKGSSDDTPPEEDTDN